MRPHEKRSSCLREIQLTPKNIIIMEEKKEKRVLRIELDDDVKKLSITGKNGEDKVVMSQELNEDDLDQVAGGFSPIYVPKKPL